MALEAQKEQKHDTVYFARTNFRGESRIFGMNRRDRRQHTYIIGKTGCGKSVLLKNMAVQDIQNGDGVAVVDPHGELVEQILATIPPNRVNDVVYFNPADADYPIGFNVLEVPDVRYKHVVASDLMGIFTKIWANVWSARMEYILQNCVLALLDTPGTTLLGIPRLLVDREYRGKIIANLKDPVVRAFWTQEYENYTDRLRSEAIVPIQNKVGQFLNTAMIRNIVGQPKSTFNVQDLMNNGKILLVNVSKGRVGEDNSALMGAMIITKLQLGAMERVRVPEDERKDFYLYVDEFQSFATDSFASVLSEARKYRLNLTIAHQYIGQLVTDVSTKVRDAVFGNTGTIITFRCGAADAEYLETEFTPEFLPPDIVNLPNYHIYLKLMVDGVTSRPFSATTLPPIPVVESIDTAEKVIRISRERYTVPREKVEERILRWSGMASGNDAGEADTDGGGALPTPTSSVKEEFEAVCASCGKRMKLSFRPDPRRPVYCQTCLKKVKEGEVLPISMPRSVLQEGARADKPARTYDDSLASLGIEFQQSPVSVKSTVMQQALGDQTAFAKKTDAFYDATCARCGKSTKVSFEPNSSRPVYCKLCLPVARSLQMRKNNHQQFVAPGRPIPHHSRDELLAVRPVRRDEGVKILAAVKTISLKEALAQDGSTFSGKKLKRKEVDLSSLRAALAASLASQDVPDAPAPDGDTADSAHQTAYQKTSDVSPKGTALQPGAKVTLRQQHNN